MNERIYVGNAGEQRKEELRRAFEFTGLYEALSRSTKVFVKPNFTFPGPLRGVTTSREILQDTLQILGDSGVEVFVGESNGGYGSFLASESFAGHRLREICHLTHTQPIDLSVEDLKECRGSVGGKMTSVRLPRLLVEDVDFTISLPVLKVHAMTTVSLSMKNLWGCYPTDLRLLEHKELDRKLVLISRLIRARFGIVDALYGLDRHGPMEGTARFIGEFIAGNNLLTLDTCCARMMGFDPKGIQHLKNLLMFSDSRGWTSAVDSNVDVTKYDWGFTLQRDFVDSLSFACFHSELLAKIVFDSPMTAPIYRVLGREPHRKLTPPAEIAE